MAHQLRAVQEFYIGDCRLLELLNLDFNFELTMKIRSCRDNACGSYDQQSYGYAHLLITYMAPYIANSFNTKNLFDVDIFILTLYISLLCLPTNVLYLAVSYMK